MTNRYVIIVAAGKGVRVGGPVPKQFLPLDGKPVLMHTIEAFRGTAKIVLVLGKDNFDYWRELCGQYGFEAEYTLVAGGAERFNSVKNALAAIPDDAIVGVHDGVRPFVTPSVIEDAFKTAEEQGCAVPVVDCTDSVRIVSEDGSSNAPIDRSRVKLVQTPQVFRASMLKQAYNVEFSPLFTDDASVVEHAGHKIHLTKGDIKNKKITYISDIKF
ncbi:MAG: 2-C-methyl-D-erythritol 4-phosphate cytidylyltransferase [Bacteroidales bacterium]|nr:2-C-methyl-D-erythritol 4-phosphate cytidylyltransferase [Bacteroidales bacterium]MDY6426916.1 2-C-methyl-D-erythritol 4-phosphate cytidylyltransferase [Bacteroidales bacterium]